MTALKQSVAEHLSSMKDTLGVLQWCKQQFVNQKAQTFFTHVLFWSILARLVSLMYPWFMGTGIDALYTKNSAIAVWSVVGICFTFVFGALFEWRSGHFVELIFGENLRTIDHKINELFFSKNLGLHLQEGGKLTQENMEKGWNRFDIVQKSFMFGGLDAAITLVLSLGMLFAQSFVSGLIISFGIFTNVLLSLSLNNMVTTHMEPVESMFRALARRRGERWQGVERVITNGKESEEIDSMDKAFAEALKADRKIWLSYIRGTIPRSLIVGFSVTAVGLYAGWSTWNGTMAVAEIVPILTWAGMASQQIRLMARVEREINWCTPSLKSLREALSLPVQLTRVDDPVHLEDAPVEVSFENLGHGYPSKDGNNMVPILSHLSFSVRKGEKVALIGPSGAGKSTITKLVQRYMDPISGCVRINGHDLRNVDEHSWRQLVGYVPQQAKIFEGTLRDNLVYGLSAHERAQITDEDIWRIIRLLRIDFGGRLTDGLNTKVGRKGMKLSGGEAQRIMIGAAALKRPRFMIIDEATSSLDAENQAAVQAGIDQLLAQEGASAIIIAHRLSTILRCDKFVVLKPVDQLVNGESQIEKIAYSPKELFDECQTFRRLAELEGLHVAF